MDAVNREGQGQIDAVIDEEDGSSAVHDGQEPLRQSIEGPCGEVLFAKLDGYGAALKRGIDHHLKGPTLCKGAVGDNVKTPRRGFIVHSSEFRVPSWRVQSSYFRVHGSEMESSQLAGSAQAANGQSMNYELSTLNYSIIPSSGLEAVA
jgi:hypothetical protein